MNYFISKYCLIRNQELIIDGLTVFKLSDNLNFVEFIRNLYKHQEINYPKFYKMDDISKLGFLTSEILIKDQNLLQYQPNEIGIILSNSVGTYETDFKHNQSISDKKNYFPSPAIFVYTLPNIVIGEICIKNKITGENVFFISERFDNQLFDIYANYLFDNNLCSACIAGWVDKKDENYQSIMFLLQKSTDNNLINKNLTFKNIGEI